MSQYGGYAQTLGSDFNFPKSSFPGNNKLLDVINEASRDSRTEISDMELSKKFFNNPMADYSRQKESFMSKDAMNGDKFLSNMIGQTSQIIPNVSVKGDTSYSASNFSYNIANKQQLPTNYPSNQYPAYAPAPSENMYNFSGSNTYDALSSNKWGTQLNSNIQTFTNSAPFSTLQFESKPSSSYDPLLEAGQQKFSQSEYQTTNINQNTAVGNFANGDSEVTEDTKDLSDLSIGNFKKAFHNKDNSYNLNLTKMGEVSINQSQNTPKTPEHQKFLKSLGFGNSSPNLRTNYTNQPTDLLNFVNSNTYATNLQAPGNFAAITHLSQHPAETATRVINPQHPTNSTKPVVKESNVKTKNNDTTEIEVILADLDPLELSEIAPLSDNFLDDDDETDQHQVKTFTKKLSREQSDLLKKEQRQKSISEPGKINMPQNHSQPPNNIQEIQSQYMSNYNSVFTNKEADASPNSFLPSQNFMNYNTQAFLAGQPLSVQMNDLDKRAKTPPLNNSATNMASDTFNNQYAGINTNIPRPGSLTIPAQVHYRSESKDNLQPYSLENQYTSNVTGGAYQSIPTMNYSTSPMMLQNKMAEPVPNYQQINSNYHPSYENNLKIPSQGSMTSINNSAPSKNSQMISGKDYYNPFTLGTPSTQSSLTPSQQSSHNNQFNNPSITLNRQTQQSFSSQRDLSPLKKTEEETEEIVNKMQHLYRDWKEKNAELNTYLNELVHSTSQSKFERLSIGRDDSPSNQYRKTMQGPAIQRNTMTVNEKSNLPYDFRYSVQPAKMDSTSSRENFQAFMKEDLLKGMEQEGKKSEIKPSFKKFSNPIFEKQTIGGYDDSYSSGKTEPQRESQKNQSKIFETRNDRPKYPQNEIGFLQNLTRNSVQNPRANQPSYQTEKSPIQRTYNQEQKNMTDARSYSPIDRDQRQKNPREVYKPDFTKPEKQSIQNQTYFDSSVPPDSERTRHGTKNFDFPKNNYKAGIDHFNKHSVFGFDVKKDKLIEGVDKRKIETQQMEIVCMNCQELIKVNEVDSHSEVCQKGQKQKETNVELFGLDGIQEFNNKLSNIRQKIVSKVSSLQMKKSLDFKVKQLLRCLDGAIYENSSLEELSFLINEGEKLIEEISEENLLPQESFLLIYFSRFIVILKEKYAEIQIATLEEPELLELKTKIQEYEKETERKKAELALWKNQAQMMRDIQLHDHKNIHYVKTQYQNRTEALSDINSEVKHSDNEGSDEGESIMTTVTPSPSLPASGRKVNENEKPESGKIRFYSLVVNAKLLLPPSNPGKDLLISDLYDECQQLNIPEEKWEFFTKKKLGLIG